MFDEKQIPPHVAYYNMVVDSFPLTCNISVGEVACLVQPLCPTSDMNNDN